MRCVECCQINFLRFEREHVVFDGQNRRYGSFHSITWSVERKKRWRFFSFCTKIGRAFPLKIGKGCTREHRARPIQFCLSPRRWQHRALLFPSGQRLEAEQLWRHFLFLWLLTALIDSRWVTFREQGRKSRRKRRALIVPQGSSLLLFYLRSFAFAS